MNFNPVVRERELLKSRTTGLKFDVTALLEPIPGGHDTQVSPSLQPAAQLSASHPHLQSRCGPDPARHMRLPPTRQAQIPRDVVL